eukprot:g2397.t1
MAVGDAEKKVICGVCGVVAIVSIFLIAFSFYIIDYDEYGLKVNAYSWHLIDEEVYDSGRHFTGLGVAFQKFKKNVIYIDFVGNEEDENVDKDENDDDVGSQAAETSGPITIRTSDGQRVDISLSLEYSVDKDKLANLYRSYGTEYDEFLVAMMRARIRDEGAKFSSTQLFTSRIQIEQHMKQMLEQELEKKFVKLNGFQLRKIKLPHALELTLKNILLAKVQLDLTSAKLETLRITSNTSAILKEREGTRNKELLKKRENIIKDVRLQQQDLARVKYETERLVAIAAAEKDKALEEYNAATLVLEEVLAGNISIVEAVTSQQMRDIQNRIDKLIANSSAKIVGIATEAEGSRIEKLADAQANYTLAESQALKKAYTDMRSQVAVDAEGLLNMEFTGVIGEHDTGNLKMDLQKPSMLFLPGQEASAKKNLADNNADVL